MSEGGRGQRQRGRHRKIPQNREPYTEGQPGSIQGPESKERSSDQTVPWVQETYRDNHVVHRHKRSTEAGMASWWKLNRKASGNRLKLREEEENPSLCTENSWGPMEMSRKLEEALIF